MAAPAPSRAARPRMEATPPANTSAPATTACASDTSSRSRRVSVPSTSRPATGASTAIGPIRAANRPATAAPEPVRSWTRRASTTTISRSPAADTRMAPASRRRSRGALIGSLVPGLDADPAHDLAVAHVGQRMADDEPAGRVRARHGERGALARGEAVADAADDAALVGGADPGDDGGAAVHDGRRARLRALVDLDPFDVVGEHRLQGGDGVPGVAQGGDVQRRGGGGVVMAAT